MTSNDPAAVARQSAASLVAAVATRWRTCTWRNAPCTISHSLTSPAAGVWLAFALATASQAQTFSIDWFSLDGGGGTSTGGVYSITGTIGQPDVGTMSGGNFTLVGGFWGIVAAVQRPGAPWLTVTRTNTTVVVSWPLPAEGWVLEWTNALPRVAAPWPQLLPPYQTNGPNLQFTEPSPAGNKFYRLHKP